MILRLKDKLEPKEAHEIWPKSTDSISGYLINHWRGDLSLSKSFWINGFTVNIILIFIYYYIDYSGNNASSLYEWIITFWAFLLALLMHIMIGAWQIVGIWRSASNREKFLGESIFSIVAQLSCVLVILQLIWTSRPILTHPEAFFYATRFSLGLERLGAFRVRETYNSSGISITGVLAKGLISDFKNQIKSQNNASYVVLNSRGGRQLVGENLYNIIRQHNMSTFVKDNCFSACTFAFLGGKNRIVSPRAELGFHTPALEGLTDKDTLIAKETKEATKDLMGQLMANQGIKNSFIKRSTNTPNKKMWKPSLDVLANANVITHVFHNGKLTPAEEFSVSKPR